MSVRSRLRKKLNTEKAKEKKCTALKEEALKILKAKEHQGIFDDFKYIYFTKSQYLEFCRQSIECENFAEFDSQTTIDGYAGMMDKFESINELLAKNNWMLHDGMLGPIKFLFDCGKNNRH